MEVQTKKYHLWTIGCQMNEADSRHLASQLETMGYTPCPLPEEADLVVLNTCVVRQQAENRIYGRLGSLKTIKHERPDMTIGLMGCLVGVKEAPALRKRFPYVDVFMPPSDSGPLIDYLQANDQVETLQLEEQRDRTLRDAIQDSKNLLPIEQRGKAVTAFVPIVLGCSHACTFCIIPYRRGLERSRSTDEIVAEVKALVGQGIREVTLLGQIVDRFGLDLPEPATLASLLREINAIAGLERIRFLTSHPNWMTDELLDAVAELDKVCPHLEVPVQAGNDIVLENMRRGYTVDKYYELIDRIRARIPHAAIHTDIIVGFPGESEAQFKDTYNLLETVQFDKVHISKYSVRPKTVAARRMPDDVSEKEKSRRRDLLDQLQRSSLTGKNQQLVGKTVSVLVESEQKGRWRGRTPHNKLVFFEDDSDLIGRIVDVQIDHAGPWSLLGKMIA